MPEVRWGNVECLSDDMRTLKILNDSLIPADLNLFLRAAKSKFTLPMKEAHLEPGQELDLEITANLDDTVVIKDELHITVHEGENLIVPLVAKGVGTTIWCVISISFSCGDSSFFPLSPYS
jgi:hypothetical protein